MRFLIDESVRRSIGEFLKERNFDVKMIGLDFKGGLSDKEVIKIAQREKRILITNDTDFGDLVFYFGYQLPGLILFRLQLETKENVLNLLKEVLEHHLDRLEKHFVVVTENQIRFRSI